RRRHTRCLSDWSSDVCSSDLELSGGRGFVLVSGFPVAGWSLEQAELAAWIVGLHLGEPGAQNTAGDLLGHVRDVGAERAHADEQIGRASCRERVWIVVGRVMW